MLLDVIAVRYYGEYKLILKFENGEEKLVDLQDRLEGPIFQPLKDLDFFKQVTLDPELGTIIWPNGADKAPETLYQIGKPVPNG